MSYVFLFVNLNVSCGHVTTNFTRDRNIGLCYSDYMLRQFRSTARLFVLRPSVCLSHARIVSKRLNIIIIIRDLSLSDRPIILVFDTKGCCVRFTASPLTGRRIQGGSDFQLLLLYLGNDNPQLIEAWKTNMCSIE